MVGVKSTKVQAVRGWNLYEVPGWGSERIVGEKELVTKRTDTMRVAICAVNVQNNGAIIAERRALGYFRGTE
jgi:hypothetical protein